MERMRAEQDCFRLALSGELPPQMTEGQNGFIARFSLPLSAIPSSEGGKVSFLNSLKKAALGRLFIPP